MGSSRQEPEGLLDREVLQQLRDVDGTAEFLAEIIDLFLEDAPPRITSIVEATAAGDAAAAASEAHALRSSAGNIGAVRVRELCTAIEAEAREGRLSIARTAELEAAYAAVVHELRMEREK